MICRIGYSSGPRTPQHVAFTVPAGARLIDLTEFDKSVDGGFVSARLLFVSDSIVPDGLHLAVEEDGYRGRPPSVIDFLRADARRHGLASAEYASSVVNMLALQMRVEMIRAGDLPGLPIRP